MRKPNIDSNLPTDSDNNMKRIKTASTAFRPPTSFKKKKKKSNSSHKRKLTLKEQRDKECN